jgi:hypothetical protein
MKLLKQRGKLDNYLYKIGFVQCSQKLKELSEEKVPHGNDRRKFHYILHVEHLLLTKHVISGISISRCGFYFLTLHSKFVTYKLKMLQNSIWEDYNLNASMLWLPQHTVILLTCVYGE